MTNSPTLYVIRHGETEWSLSGQHTGHADIPLTAHGEDQARALMAPLRAIEFTHVFSSPRQRARRTCELALDGRAPEVIDDLGEWDYGAYEGLRSTEIHARDPAWNLWTDGGPGGETPVDVVRRVDALIARMLTLSGRIALFSHGHLSCALAARWIGLALAEGEHFVLDPASLGILGVVPRHEDVRAIALWNASARSLAAR